jgi:hypothetical protein
MKIKLFKDILKVKLDGVYKYSQGRVYLFVFVILYIACLTYYTFIANLPASAQTIIDSLQWAIFLFAAYVLGGKGVSAVKDVFKIKSGKNYLIPPIINEDQNTDTTTNSDLNSNPNDVVAPLDDINTGGKKEEDLSA